MENVVLVIHLLLTLALIGLILIQKSEGGGLGLGTGGGMGSFATAQGTKSAITKTTTWVAICFFATSLILAIMASNTDRSKSILDAATAPTPALQKEQAPPVPAIGGGAVQTTPAPAVPAPTAPEAKPTESPKVPLAQ